LHPPVPAFWPADAAIAQLWNEPVGVVVYGLVALILAWPLLALAWRRFRLARPLPAVASGASEAGHVNVPAPK
jgi:hypothetical protein